MKRLRDVLFVVTCLLSMDRFALTQDIPFVPVSDSSLLFEPTIRRNVPAPKPKGKQNLSPLMEDDRIADSAPRSVGWIFGWRAEYVAEKLTLSDSERELLVRLFKERKEANERNLKEASSKVTDATTLTQFKDLCAQYAQHERRDESKLIETLDELFPPSKMRELMILMIDADRYQFVKVGLVQQAMKLAPNQVDQFSQLGKSFLKTLGEQPNIDDRKFDPKLAAAAAEKIVSIRNSLTREQFELYAVAVGLIPKDIPLTTHLSECSRQEKEKLMIYTVCRELVSKPAD